MIYMFILMFWFYADVFVTETYFPNAKITDKNPVQTTKLQVYRSLQREKDKLRMLQRISYLPNDKSIPLKPKLKDHKSNRKTVKRYLLCHIPKSFEGTKRKKRRKVIDNNVKLIAC